MPSSTRRAFIYIRTHTAKVYTDAGREAEDKDRDPWNERERSRKKRGDMPTSSLYKENAVGRTRDEGSREDGCGCEFIDSSLLPDIIRSRYRLSIRIANICSPT